MENKLTRVEGNIYGMGVYAFIRETDNSVLYVGSGMMNDRLSTHLYNLKRGLYFKTNKNILQEEYDSRNLRFEVLKFSENNSTYLNGTKEEKEAIQKSLETLENMYINLYKDTVCNKMINFRKPRSSNKNRYSTYNRHEANRGSNNPNSKLPTKLIANIIWLKQNGYRAKHIVNMVKENEGIDINNKYIYQIGVKKWIFTEPKKPSWID